MTPLLSVLFFLYLTPAHAEFAVPTLSGPVVDDAGLLREAVRFDLENALQLIYEKGGPQINVLTVDTIDPYTIEEASIQVAKKWGLGTAEKDNGVLLMVAKKERKVRIEVGQALEGDLTDAYSKRIIDNDIVPGFRSGDFDAGIVGGVRGILLRMNPPIRIEDYFRHAIKPKRQDRGIPLSYLILIIIAIVILRSFFGGGSGGRRYRSSGIFMGGFGGGGGFGSGGGWSGGGGGFSGGGASGSW